MSWKRRLSDRVRLEDGYDSTDTVITYVIVRKAIKTGTARAKVF